ncbi:hypothetical protein AHAS_Ahas13G0053300 [Arachis hypogaea]
MTDSCIESGHSLKIKGCYAIIQANCWAATTTISKPSLPFIAKNVSVSPSFFESLSISLESHLSHTRRRLVVRLADVSSFVTRPSSSSHSLQSRPWAPRRQRQRQLVGSWLASSLSVGSSSLAVFWFLFVVVAWTVDRCFAEITT